MADNTNSRWDILNERGSKERDKYKEEQEKQKKAAEEEKKKKEEEKKAKDEKRKAEQDRYNKAKKRTEQMSWEEFNRRLDAGEKYDDLANEFKAFQVDQRLATPGGGAQYSSFDQLPFEEQYKISAALYGGSPSSNQYVSNAMKLYKMLEGEAQTIARESGIKPDNPRYQEFIDSYIDGMYNDNFVSLDDIRGARTQMANNNDEAYQVSQQKAAEAKAEQSANQYYIDPVTGAPIEDYNTNTHPQKSAKDRFNEFMTTPNFNNWMQGWRDNPNPTASGLPDAGGFAT